jgi:hypothetical protein
MQKRAPASSPMESVSELGQSHERKMSVPDKLVDMAYLTNSSHGAHCSCNLRLYCISEITS